MPHSQRGVTFIGWLFLLAPLAIVFYAGIRLTPLYLNYMRVASSLSRLVDEHKDGQPTSVQVLRDSLWKHFDIEGIEHPDPKEIDIHRDGTGWVAIADYEDRVPVFGNVSLLVEFHKEAQIP